MSAINLEELRDRCMGIQEIMDTVLAQFRDSAEEMLTDIEKPLDAGCWDVATRAAHSLKGAAGNIAAEALRAAAAEMEAAAKRADAEACNRLRSVLRQEMERCLREVPAPQSR